MSEMIKSEEISRRKALSLLGLVAAFNLAASSTVLTVSKVEAQTAGMERRHERRTGRTERSGARSDVTERSALDRAVLVIPDIESHGQIRR